jgi:preprotein translocase subunit SecE
MEKAISFLKEAKAELLKVSWPTREQLIRNTVAVVVVSIAVAIFLGALDYVFSYFAEVFLF